MGAGAMHWWPMQIPIVVMALVCSMVLSGCSTSVWAPWGWKWWFANSKEFYAYGNGSIGDAKNPARYCQPILS